MFYVLKQAPSYFSEKNTATLFCCEAPEMFLKKIHQLSIGIEGSR